MPHISADESLRPERAASSRLLRGGRVAWIGWLLAALAVAVGAWSVFPDLVIVFNDDFGYLRSIVHTLEHGRPWTDDWLEPWAASLSGISALLFRATGSFQLATQGLQVVAIVATWWLATRWLRDCGAGRIVAAIGALLAITLPTLLFKGIEYGSMVISVPALLLCGWCASRRHWTAFFVVWLIAVATRQSAAVWLALPAWCAGREWFERRRAPGSTAPAPAGRRRWLAPAVVVVLGVLAYVALHASMNETYAQRTLTPGMFAQWDATIAVRHFGWAAGLFVVAVGVSAFVQQFGVAPSLGPRVPEPGWFRWTQLAALAGVLGFFLIDPRRHVAWEHPLCDGERGRAYLALWWLLAAIGWWRGGFRVRGEWLALGLAATALVCLRRMVWDYYFTDIALAAVLGTWRTAVPAAEPTTRARLADSWLGRHGERLIRFGALLVALAVAGWHFLLVRDLKNQLTGQAAIVALSEHALRAGRISPTQLTLGPFGYQGWHWYPHFVKQDGPRGEFIANFLGYLGGNSLEFSSSAPGAPPWRFNEVSVTPPSPVGGGATSRELASGVFLWEWRIPTRFALLRPESAESPPPKTVDASRVPYEPQRFPLTDAEWREYIAARCGR